MKLFPSCMLIFFFILTALEGSPLKGKAIYEKNCLPSHISGKGMASSKPAQTWKALLLAKEGSQGTLAHIHLGTGEANASWEYFKSATYQDDSTHLKDFLQKYSSDRGKHNSCY